MLEKNEKFKVIEAIGERLPSMTEQEKTYLMGFLEGFAANVVTMSQQEPQRLAGQPSA